jgi:hypothetical protein
MDIKLIYPRLAAAINARDLNALDGLISNLQSLISQQNEHLP